MTITQEQRTYARLAGILFLANYVVLELVNNASRSSRRSAVAARRSWALPASCSA